MTSRRTRPHPAEGRRASEASVDAQCIVAQDSADCVELSRAELRAGGRRRQPDQARRSTACSTAAISPAKWITTPSRAQNATLNSRPDAQPTGSPAIARRCHFDPGGRTITDWNSASRRSADTFGTPYSSASPSATKRPAASPTLQGRSTPRPESRANGRPASIPPTSGGRACLVRLAERRPGRPGRGHRARLDRSVIGALPGVGQVPAAGPGESSAGLRREGHCGREVLGVESVGGRGGL